MKKNQNQARLAQSVEHETLNLRVVGSSPTLGDFFNYGIELRVSHVIICHNIAV